MNACNFLRFGDSTFSIFACNFFQKVLAKNKRWVDEAIQTNWVSTVGQNINVVEQEIASYLGIPHAVALSCGTAALHLAIKLAGEKLYGAPRPGHGTLEGHKVFCSDTTFDATVNPAAYEGAELVFIDTEYDTWNMDPVALSRAFELYPDVRLIVGLLFRRMDICEFFV